MRRIVHLDADAFFASVEQAADPRLRGRPVAVGGEKRGIIASASYEARKFGIYTPMPTVRARKLCPKLILLPGDFEKYEHFSRWMFSYAYDFTPDVEVTSIDEGYFDLSGARRPAVDIARTIRQAIGQSLKISVSEGIAANKLISQIASKLHKPAAFAHIPDGTETGFLHPLPNHWLPGVGPQTASRLNAAGLALVGQIATTPPELLHLLLGRWAIGLQAFARGIDERPVVPARAAAKSYGHQETFAEDQTDEAFLEATLRRMADRLMAQVRADGKSIRTLTVKVRYNDMDEDQRSESLPEPTDLESDLYPRLRPLLRQAWKRRVSLRLVSLKVSNLYDSFLPADLPLLAAARQRDAQRRLATVIDELRHQRGARVILRGHDLALRDHGRGGKEEGRRQNVEKSLPSAFRLLPSSLPLCLHSHYSFLNSTLSIDALVEQARRDKLSAVALTDEGNLHGAVPFTLKARAAGLRPILGATLRVGGQTVRLYVQNAEGYHNLCRILSGGKEEGRMQNAECRNIPRPEGPRDSSAFCILPSSLAAKGGLGGLIAVAADPALAARFPGRFYQAVTSPRTARDIARDLPAVAALPVRYATPAGRHWFDILQSIRTNTLLGQPHPDKLARGAFHFRSQLELAGRFRDHPELLRRTHEIADRCEFELPLAPPQFPAFHPADGRSSRAFLRHLVWAGLRRRYGHLATGLDRLRRQVREELAIIHDVGYEEYFLVVWNLLQECRRRGIEWITRGSAADSLVCYCLGISDVCPIRFDLFFRRFLNKERMSMHKLPDIDVDFPHDRKDDVIDLIFEIYGTRQAAVVGGFSTFQTRSAVADIAKVLGVSEHQIRRFTEHMPWTYAKEEGGMQNAEAESHISHLKSQISDSPLYQALKASPECGDMPLDEEPYRTALLMAEFLQDVPRHPKMHPCGVVLSRQPMHQITPTFTSRKGYPTTHFDMDAVEAVGLVKIDILAQGGLAAMRDVRLHLEERIRQTEDAHEIATLREAQDYATCHSAFRLLPSSLPSDDPAVWDMIASGGARAVHHIESPAMVSLCRMSNVRDLDGLIAIVSVIRPGAANEQKKLQFTRRYQKLEPVTCPHPVLAPILRSTFGLVVYEEHILQICEAFAGMPLGRADTLRRALVKLNHRLIDDIGLEFAAGARARGHDEAILREVWDLVRGFAGYAFCKAHSTAYGVEAYQSAWLKKYYPAEFMAAVLTNGKGFYHPLVYVLECHRLGIPLLPPCVNTPGPHFVVEGRRENAEGRKMDPSLPSAFCILPSSLIRVPATRIKGLTETTRERMVAERARRPFASLHDFAQRAGALPEEMEALLRAGAFDTFGPSRTRLFWEIQAEAKAEGRRENAESGRQMNLFPSAFCPLPSAFSEPDRKQRLQWEMDLLDFPASGHPLELHGDIDWKSYCPVAELGKHVGEKVVTCGLIIEQRLHHQATGEPMKFLTLADWTGMVETELFAPTYRSYGLATVRYPVLEVTATVEPFENGRGFTLRVHRAGRPRKNVECRM